MAVTINASTTTGLVQTADTSGVLQLQTAGTTAVTIDASQRAAFVAGTAALPAITTTGDTNTGMFFPAADTIAFAEGGAEVMRIDSSGKLFIGTTVTPDSSVSLLGMRQTGGDLSSTTVTRANATGITVADSISPTNNYGNGIWFNSGALLAGIASARISTGNWGTDLRFYTHPTTTTNVDETYERMRIDSAGEFFIQCTGIDGDRPNVAGGTIKQTNGNTKVRVTSNGTAAFQFYSPGGGTSAVGSISVNASSVSYNTSSDYRLKENIAPMTGALEKITQLKPVTYTWKSDGSNGQGFIAHELQEVIPDCVTGEKDAVKTYTDEEGNEQTIPKYQGVDTSFLVATLTAAIQEQQTIINDLKARITALEGAA
jgi:hypothetical protein